MYLGRAARELAADGLVFRALRIATVPTTDAGYNVVLYESVYYDAEEEIRAKHSKMFSTIGILGDMMANTLTTIHDVPILVCEPDGAELKSERDALDLIGEAMSFGAELILVPVERHAEDFFYLKSGLAGQIMQKCVTYRWRMVILGDISQHVAGSRAFRDFVSEANHGHQV